MQERLCGTALPLISQFMGKLNSKFVCQQCGYESPRWFGKCPQCSAWNSAVETVVTSAQKTRGKEIRNSSIAPLSLASIPTKNTQRISTKISELDRVLGGGLVAGQVVLIAGEPGIGKSTLLLQVASELSVDQLTELTQSTVLYISGEESMTQIKIRADRLGIKGKSIQLMEETDVDSIIDTIYSSKDPSLKAVIVDSIQTMATSDLSGMAGSVGQVRESAFRLVRVAKENNIPIFIVGHVTKEGTVAGPSVLMHIVDTVLWFEGDKGLTYRLLRAVKNRFGPTDEVGVFLMEDKGLISLNDPEKMFITSQKSKVPGSVVTSILEGTRPILVEVQALVVPTKMPYPKRVAQGIDSKRFEILLAILQRRANLPLYEYDCFVNIAGGISIKNDPSADLAICMAIASAFYNKPLSSHAVALGEVGLLGEIRQVNSQDKRIKDAKRLGYSVIISNKETKYLSDAVKKNLS